MSEDADVSQLLSEGQELFKQHRHQEVLEALDQVLVLDPNRVDALSLKGLVLERLRRYDEALSCCEEALKRDPTRRCSYQQKPGAY